MKNARSIALGLAVVVLAWAVRQFMDLSCQPSAGSITRAEADIQNLSTQLKMYKSVTGDFPSTAQGIGALVARPIGNPQPNRWRQLLEAVPLDPWSNIYQIRNPATKSKAGIDLFSMGPDGVPGTEDDIGNWQLQD